MLRSTFSRSWLVASSVHSTGICAVPIRFKTKSYEDVEDMPTKMLRERSQKKYSKKFNTELKKDYEYQWRYPLLRFNKHYHGEFRNMINEDRIDELDARWNFLRKIGKHPSPYTVELLAEVYSRYGRVDDIIATIDILKNDRHKVTRDTFRHLAVGHIRNGNLELAEQAFASMKDIYPEASKINERVCGAFASHYKRAGDLEQVAHWMDQFKNLQDKDVYAYNRFLKEIPVEHLREELESFLSFVDDYDGASGAFDLIAYRFASDGLLDDVQSVIKQMEAKELDVTADVYDSLILALTKNDQLDEALNTMEKMRQNGTAICYSSYCDVIAECATQNRDADVEKLLSEVQLSGEDPSTPKASRALTNYFAQKGDYLNTKKFWLIAKDNNALYDPRMSHDPISLACKHSHATALEMFTHLNENHLIPLSETFDILIDAHRKHKLEKQAKIIEQQKFRCFN